MSDWRLNGQEEYLFNKTLYKISFPTFWETAYRDKNYFYKSIELDAKQFVEKMNRGYEFLESGKIQYFWHKHCEFCFEKASTDKICTFYCTENLVYWICEKCFHDFKEKFNWNEQIAENLL